jgi:hypothetical protein
MTDAMIIALAFNLGILSGLIVVTAAARHRARLRQRDRLATAQHLALVRALSQP